ALLIAFASSPALAQQQPAAAQRAAREGILRTVLVIDASSSMRATDPRALRKVAAELYVDLAREGDQIAVTGFDGAARESTGAFVTIKTPADRAALKQAVRNVGNDGSWTDFTAGLAEAKRLLDAAVNEPGDQEFVLFLTDGRCDPDPRGALAEARKAAGAQRMEDFCQQRVLADFATSLGGARIYAIGLSRSAPRAFLEDLARRTGGVGLATDRAEELPRLFADVYARLLGSTLVEGASAEAIPIAVEEGALSLDVVLVGPPTLTARLTDPTGADVPTDNARPDAAYFVDTPDYRLFKVERPAIGPWKLSVGGGAAAAKGRYAALQNLDLRLGLVDPPEVIEIGKERSLRVRLATPGGKVPPASFLDRHEVSLRVAEASFDARGSGAPDGAQRPEPLASCAGALAAAPPVVLRRGPDGAYEIRRTPSARGELCLQARLAPGPGGVLSRESPVAVLRVVPPLRLAGAPIDLGPIKQDAAGKAWLTLEGSEIGEPIEAELHLAGRDDLELEPEAISLDPKGPRAFVLRLEASRDALPGPAALKLTVRPMKPRGYEDRAIELDLKATILPLTFWERYHRWIEIGGGALLFLFLALGVALPARFDRRAVLRYKDARDPDLPREGSYPLGVKAKPGFYRGARLLVAPTGPVRIGGVVELRPAPGGGVTARPLGARAARELPREDPSGMAPPGDPRPVPLRDGRFRCSPGTRYEIEGTGLILWIEGR
ncbi:MAG: VWA domain-containing protein, partial [Polyangiaceae bacterium]|nr:VWA domain-containing protein [Polyangiaceae bacterium]